MLALPARQAPPHTIISRPVQTALALWRPRSGAAGSFRHPFGRAGPAPGSVGAPRIGPPFPPPAPPDPPLPPMPAPPLLPPALPDPTAPPPESDRPAPAPPAPFLP